MGQDVSHSEIEDWLRIDNGDSGYQHLTDDEIDSQFSSAVEGDDDDEQPDCSPQTTTSISNGEAVRMFDTCLEWLRQQEEASTYNLTCLKELRGLAARKRLSDIKQIFFYRLCTLVKNSHVHVHTYS